MSKDPAFLFYSSDFLTGVAFMSDEQIGRYIKLLCLQHQKGKLTLKQMLSQTLTKDEDIFEKFDIDEDGMYYNKRLFDEMEKRKKYNPRKIASATLGGLISSKGLKAKQVRFIKDRFNINDFIELKSNEEIKTHVSKWLSMCLTIYENENEKTIYLDYKEFYSNELNKSNNNDVYEKFINWLTTENNILRRPLKNVLEMKEQISWNQFQVLMEEMSSDENKGIKISEIIVEMENWLMSNPKKKSQGFLGTMRTFIKNRKKK